MRAIFGTFIGSLIILLILLYAGAPNCLIAAGHNLLMAERGRCRLDLRRVGPNRELRAAGTRLSIDLHQVAIDVMFKSTR